MIGYLEGKIKIVSQGYIVVDCSGVGYRIEVGGNFPSLKVGDLREFYIHTHVREDELLLFGFMRQDELELFEILLQVNGVGPKAAKALLSNLGVTRIVTAIFERNADDLKVPSVGKKTAEKIILELGDTLEKKGFKKGGVTAGTLPSKDLLVKLNEAQSALTNLGYPKNSIDRAISDLKAEKGIDKLDMQQIVKYLLTHATR